MVRNWDFSSCLDGLLMSHWKRLDSELFCHNPHEDFSHTQMFCSLSYVGNSTIQGPALWFLLWFKLEKELREMHYFPNNFPVTLEKTKLVPSTLSDQNTNLAAHLSLQTCQLPATFLPTWLFHYATTKLKQLLFSIMEILSTSPVCLTSVLQHYLWHLLSANTRSIEVPLFVSSSPSPHSL